MSQRFSLLTPVGLGVLLSALVGAYSGCKKDEPPPPMPSAAPAPPPPPQEPLALVPEDASVPIDAGDDAAVKKGGSGQSLSKCCAALASNAALAPSPNKEYLLAAAQACSIAVGAGQSNAAVLSAVSGALKGAGMPASCK